MRHLALAILLPAIFVSAGCPSETQQAPQGPVAETVSPKDSPLPYKVLSDVTIPAENRAEYHVLLSAPPKHDQAEELLKFLYRHLKTRDPSPAGVGAYVYTDEVQYKTPPRSPIAQVVQSPSDVGPKFENKVPLEFWQEVEQALPHNDKGWKLEKKIERNDAEHAVTIIQPYTEGAPPVAKKVEATEGEKRSGANAARGSAEPVARPPKPGEKPAEKPAAPAAPEANPQDRYADKLSFNIAINTFTDTAQALFENVPDLKTLTFVGRWKDQDVLKVTVDRQTYQALRLNEIEEQIGQLHGTAFLKGSTGHGTDASISKELEQKRAALYRKMLSQINPKPVVAASLK